MKINILLFIIIVSILSACKSPEIQISKPTEVYITGKVKNINPDNRELKFYINHFGADQEECITELNDNGEFKITLTTYSATDIWVKYTSNFLILVKPGEYLELIIDGSKNSREDILRALKFRGDGAKRNQHAAAFQYMYFTNELYKGKDKLRNIQKNYNIDEYTRYLDTIKQNIEVLLEEFIDIVDPIEEVKYWAKTYLDGDYADAITFYTREHRTANNLDRKWDVPIEFYEKMHEILPIRKEQFMSAYSLSSITNRYHYSYIYKLSNQRRIIKDDRDSLRINTIINDCPDNFLAQMVLNEFIRQNMERYNLKPYEKYKKLIDTFITEPCLITPLKEQYRKAKIMMENPALAINTIIEDCDNFFVNQIMDSILNIGQNKVVYMDTWATWCSPCLSEMPRSKMLMKKLEKEDVVFVFVCVDSEKSIWKAKLSEFQLEGHHFYLNRSQSSDFRKLLDIKGIPFYTLIDKAGNIVEKGSHLRPNTASTKIKELLN